MKKLLLLLLCTQLTMRAMEQPHSAAGKKRPAAAGGSEDIEILKEGEKIATAKQPRAAKKVYMLKVRVPGSAVIIDELIDITEVQDVVAVESIAELMELAKKNKKILYLARVPTSDQGKNYVEYYLHNNLHRAVFGNQERPQNPNAVSRYTLQTPKRATIAGEIYYYAYLPEIDSFYFLGTDREWFTEPATIGKRMYEYGMEAYKRKNYNDGDSLLSTAAQKFGYDLASVALVWNLRKVIKRATEQDPALTDKREIKNFIDYFISAIKDKPAGFLLDIFPEEFTRSEKINNMITLLSDIVKFHFSNQMKAVIQQKLAELQKLAQ